jgi:predicted RNA-binding protein associated with RNAse of E/G family
MFDDQERIVEWYIDTCRSQGITDQGVPWFDDLYLDVVVLKDGEVFLLDEDELEDALSRKHITTGDYDLANRTAKELLHAIDAHVFPYFQLSLKHRKTLFENGEFRKNVQI